MSLIVVSEEAWRSAISLLEVVASGTWGGDDDWDAVVKRHAKQWLEEHLSAQRSLHSVRKR